MDTRFLETLVAIVEGGSIAEAARALNLTPATIAQRIHALEGEIGTRLLVRAGRRVTPTAAGIAVAGRARRLLREVQDLRVAAHGDLPSGELRIGAISTALTGILPRILRTMVQDYPAIDVYLVPGKSVDLYNQVADGELDIALMVQPPFRYSKSCSWAELRSEPLVVLAPADVEESDPLRLLGTMPFIRYDRRYWGGRQVDSYLRSQRITPGDRLELDSLEAIAVMVDRGLGVTLVPEWAEPWPAGLDIRRIPLPAPAPARRVGLFWMRNSSRSSLVEAFRRSAVAAPWK